jgi:carbon-monoxide dehydrogenase small subunit
MYTAGHRSDFQKQEDTMTQTIHLRVNGTEHTVQVPPQRLLIDCLRYDLGLTGTKEGCSVGVCGACTVLMDGQMVSTCLVLAVRADGTDIMTIEGLAQNGQVALQQFFINCGDFSAASALGMIMAAKALLDNNPTPTEDDIKDWMMGNLCRCTGYYKIITSIQDAATRLQSGTTS